ncbi:4-(cytidine 5'-diphospho)-2-C-methyl-D-erythritol kinase [Dokdonella sp.]|uniref:4-(cytidine 5'-diphospho)-2-C-methyl-D-erythritol kinase n=1 Tax=Dokdonella sp. TaxID=2291710 RepID=UPI003C46DAA8
MGHAVIESGGGWTAWPAPAKLNLFLHVTGRRKDGYHLLQTVFQLLDWGDTIHLRIRRDDSIRRIGALPGVAEQDDLVVRAARLLQRATSTGLGAEIRIDKQIPMGGGLGGGSSDAATTLVALNLLWNCGLGISELAELGACLGADVPVFVHGRSAFAEGVGEQLTPLDLPDQCYVVVYPGTGVPTAELFQCAELTRDSAPLTIAGFVSGASARNAFEPVVRARYPEVAQALDWLGQFGDSRLSGTGASVFVVVDMDRAQAIVDQCPSGMRAWVVRGVNRSPLLAMLPVNGGHVA